MTRRLLSRLVVIYATTFAATYAILHWWLVG